nr:hypothetical protein [Candidatus Sigynarchaeota archaeon]
MRAVTVAMVLVSAGTAAICAYVSVSSYFLGSNIMTQFQSFMGGGGSNSSTGPFNMTMSNTSVSMWLPFLFNNTGSVGLDIKNLVVNVSLTTQNGTSLKTSTNAGSIPFGTSRMLNITFVDTTPAQAMALGNQSIDLDLQFGMTIAFPSSWGLFALDISRLKFGFAVQGVRFG